MKIQTEMVVEVDGARFYFEKPGRKDIFLAPTGTNEQIEAMFSKLRKVEGLEDHHGNPITDVASVDLPIDAVIQIFKGWNDEIRRMFGITEANAKNASA